MYILKQYDYDLLWFDMNNTLDGLDVHITKINEEYKHLLPLSFTGSDSSLKSWLKSRVIPRNRAYVTNFLSKFNLNERDTKGIIDICQGLSLNDAYWVVFENSLDTFEKRNLYTNPLNTLIASIAFTGYGSQVRSTFQSSPEFTTQGMLAKSWRKLNGQILLYKSGSEGFSNSGLEPYSEFYASMIADKMELNYVPYSLSKWKGKLCSVCPLFTDIHTSYMPASSLIQKGGIQAVLNYYQALGEEFYQQLIDMLVFDAIIFNEDRHLGNFGFLIDNEQNQIIACAPIHDNGLSLLCYGTDDLENSYASTRKPALYDDFISFVKPLMSHRQKEKVRAVLTFEFDKHTTYKLPNNRLKKLENLIHQQAKKLLANELIS